MKDEAHIQAHKWTTHSQCLAHVIKALAFLDRKISGNLLHRHIVWTLKYQVPGYKIEDFLLKMPYAL